MFALGAGALRADNEPDGEDRSAGGQYHGSRREQSVLIARVTKAAPRSGLAAGP